MYVISFDQYTLINFGDGVPISTMENGNIYVSSYVAMRYPLINIHTMGSPYLQMENGEDILINKFWGYIYNGEWRYPLINIVRWGPHIYRWRIENGTHIYV